MTVDRSVIGTSTGRQRVVIERGPVVVFADSVGDEDPAYLHDTAPPVPPTFPFVMAHWGAFSDMQPDSAGENEDTVVAGILGPLLDEGGLLLHGEQEFEYQSRVRVGDVLVGEGCVTDVYEKDTAHATLTFVVTETAWRHDASGEPAVLTRCNTLVRQPKQS